ncbi:dermonecrotic toxin domain-containing protein [Pseudomonas sp. Irchel 3A7]|uniref:dermonecrotic toxin domain-containing protein n=1 Tax=Pseudomonas sp. Irchel 3A7 TaxID=2008913 RepID=UPI000BA3DE2C|nr:DUF6543 domain-containing protein [Pseudomonas sp. Irchel 3A7]
MKDAPVTQKKISDTLAQAVQQEFKDRPIVITAALRQFSAALDNRYPALQIDVLTTTLNTPNWVSENIIDLQGDGENGHGVERQDTRIDGYTTTPLFEVMIHSITAKAQLYFTNGHFLSDAQDKRIEVDMREVEDLLRRLPKVMIPALQQSLVDYWNEPAVEGTSRWQWLSDVLRTALLVSMGPSASGSFLNQEQADTLLQVIQSPDKARRASRYGQDCAQAFLIDYQARTGRTLQAHLAYEVLVTRKVNGREVVVWFEPGGAIEAYDSLQAFADDQVSKKGRELEFSALELQPFESIGDVFVTQAQALLNHQLEDLNLFGSVEGQDLKVLEDRYARLTDLAPYLLKSNPGLHEQRLYDEVSSQLPDWATLANNADTQEYSRYLFRLAALQQTTKGLAYNHGIGTAEQFANQALMDGMSSYGEAVDPDLIQVTQYRNEDGELLIVEPGTGRFTSETQSLTHRALNNLAGLPFLASEFKLKDGSPAPAWMTLDNLRALISAADIGKNYPAEIKRLLLDDLAQRAEREKLFADQLRIQLPMLALENKIRQRSGFTDAGYRYVAAIMEPESEARRVTGQQIVIRPLAFKTEMSNQTHVVPDMFVFGTADETVGPHILYRPLYPEQLIEFASLDALMEEIVSNNPRPAVEFPSDSRPNPSLQKSILDWLESDVRRIYDNGGFREPHPVGVIFDTDLLRPAPAEFDKQSLSGDVLTHLYEANANILARQADEQTLSNAEYRWNTLKEMGLIVVDSVLNVVLPFVSGPAATVGWLFVMETSVLQALQALAHDDSDPIQDLTFNLLINLALSLLIHRLAPDIHTSVQPFARPSIVPRPGAVEVKPQLKPPIGPGAATAITDSVLDFSTPTSGNSRQLLERFLQINQAGRGPVITVPAPKGIEVVDGRWYAKVPGRLRGQGWANVAPTESENVVVLDNLGKPIKGLELKNNGQELWDIAPEFRVRGGGQGSSRYLSDVFADSQLRARRAKYALEVKKLNDQVKQLNANLTQAQKDGNDAYAKASAIAEKIDLGTSTGEALVALRKDLRKADLDFKKIARQFIEGHLQKVNKLEEAAKILEKDKDYQRDAIIDNLSETVNSLLAADEDLITLSGKWPQSGISDQDIFPLAFDIQKANTDAPYSVLYETRKHVLDILPERIRVSTRLEQAMAKLETLDSNARKGYLQRTGYLSKPTELLKDKFEKRKYTTQSLIIQQLVSLRGALSGDPLLDPSLTEVAGLEGLSKARLGEVTNNVLTLNSTQGFDPRLRIDLLQEAVNVYNDAELMAGNLRKVGAQQTYVPQLFLQRFLDALKSVRAIAEKELSESITEDMQGEAVPTEAEQSVAETPKKARKRTKRPNERLINTPEGYRVGETQEKTTSEPDETVAVKDIATGKDIIYYRHEGDDLYQQRNVESAQVPQLPKSTPELRTMLNEGQKLVDSINKLIGNYRKDAPLYRNPTSLEDRFLTQATKLKELAANIHQKITGVTGPDHGKAVKLYQDFKRASDQLVQEGKKLRIETTKALPPNAGSFEYLLGEHEVAIQNPTWTDKSTPKESSFLLEYEIVDSRSKKVMWYAHFHCSAQSVSSMTQAHLKLARLRFLTVKDQLIRSNGKTEGVIFPGNMKTDFSRKYFFTPLPPGRKAE